MEQDGSTGLLIPNCVAILWVYWYILLCAFSCESESSVSSNAARKQTTNNLKVKELDIDILHELSCFSLRFAAIPIMLQSAIACWTGGAAEHVCCSQAYCSNVAQ